MSKVVWLAPEGVMEYHGVGAPQLVTQSLNLGQRGHFGGKRFAWAMQLELSYDATWFTPGLLLFNEYGKRRSPILRTSRCHGARRRARERRATPAWLTEAQRAEIRALYPRCEAMNRSSFCVRYVVDHIVPLDGKLVCGLHVPWNLRLMKKRANERKSWLTWPDMPMEQLELL